MEIATFAGGCFWCTEAIFKRLKGVSEVVSGYSGGEMKDPNYEEVSSGVTGHAEAIQIKFDPNVTTYEKLLEIFLNLHDPTTLNRQGNDVGTQYRSAIFYHSAKQKQTAEKALKVLQDKMVYQNPIVTKIEPFKNFYKAEDYHQNYYENNRNQGYCRVIIDPKITKLFREFKDEVRQ